MNTIHDRWKNNGMWQKLSELKEIFVEPKNNKDLFVVMAEYRRVIEESSSKSFRTTCGAILFAVCRGKVAEGIDFSDNEARCVLMVSNILNFYLHIHMCTFIYIYICYMYIFIPLCLLGWHTVSFTK